MKCKYCDGDGVIVNVEYGHAGKYMCDHCEGTGVVEPMTNEEWFCQLPTEEKAKALETIIRNVLVQRPPMCHDICNREFWQKWLKEKRND